MKQYFVSNGFTEPTTLSLCSMNPEWNLTAETSRNDNQKRLLKKFAGGGSLLDNKEGVFGGRIPFGRLKTLDFLSNLSTTDLLDSFCGQN